MRIERQSGLTLVEMLVVFLILSLTTTLISQALGNALSIYSKTQSNRQEKQFKAMLYRWWRDSISAAAPNRLDEIKFLGTAYQINFQSFMPLFQDSGIMSEVSWSISETAPYKLVYIEPNSQRYSFELNVATEDRPTFRFLDSHGRWSSNWPGDESHSDNLPEVVSIRLGQDSLIASIRAHKESLFFIDEVEFGRGN